MLLHPDLGLFQGYDAGFPRGSALSLSPRPKFANRCQVQDDVNGAADIEPRNDDCFVFAGHLGIIM